MRGIAKAAGQTEPTAEEKDPAFIALQVRTLLGSVEAMNKVHKENNEAILKAFSMTDVHQQVLHRIVRDVTVAVSEARRLQVDGDVTAATGDLGPLKLHEERRLNMQAYYEEYRLVGETAGPELADLALIIWSQGADPEEAISRAKVERQDRALHSSQAPDSPDPDYEVEFFGGSDGQSNHEQVPQAAQANG